MVVGVLLLACHRRPENYGDRCDPESDSCGDDMVCVYRDVYGIAYRSESEVGYRCSVSYKSSRDCPEPDCPIWVEEHHTICADDGYCEIDGCDLEGAPYHGEDRISE